ISRLYITQNAARDQPRDLLEHYAGGLPRDDAVNRDHVLLIGATRVFRTGHQKLAFLINYGYDFPSDRSAVDVYIEHIQKDADAQAASVVGLNRHYFSVGGRHRVGAGWDHPVRVAEKIEAEYREQVERNGERPAQQPGDQRTGRAEPQRVVNTIGNHFQFLLSHSGAGGEGLALTLFRLRRIFLDRLPHHVAELAFDLGAIALFFARDAAPYQ